LTANRLTKAKIGEIAGVKEMDLKLANVILEELSGEEKEAQN